MLSHHMFWHLLPAPVVGGQKCMLPPLGGEEWKGKQGFFKPKTEIVQPHRIEPVKQVRESHVTDEFDLANLIQRKAELSYAMAVRHGQDRRLVRRGRGQGDERRGKSDRRKTGEVKTEWCHGQRYMETFKIWQRSSGMRVKFWENLDLMLSGTHLIRV